MQDLVARARGAGAVLVFVQHYGPPGSPIAQGGPAWELADGLDPREGELRVQKTRPSIFFGTDLAEQFTAAGVSHLILAGMKTDYCIDTSCRVASELGLRVTLAADAHTTTDSAVLPAATIVAHHTLTLGNAFAQTLPATQIVFEVK